MQGLVTVFGGSGFIGTQVVRALARRGLRVRAAVRRPNLAYALKLAGDVGQIEIVQANIRDKASVDRALDGAQGCVNLVGVLYEAGRQTFQALHEEGAAVVARSAAERGLGRLVQMSAIGADPQSPSAYARTKAAGEAAARAAFAGATIVRPSVVFGPEDSFFNRFAALASISPVLPMPGGGETRLQPVFVGDVAEAIAAALCDPAAAGRAFELGGPGVYTLREILELVLAETQRRRVLLPLPAPAARLIGSICELPTRVLPFLAPALTVDQAAQLARDNVVDPAAPGLEALGVSPTAVEAVLPTYLYRYRRGGQFADAPVVAGVGQAAG